MDMKHALIGVVLTTLLFVACGSDSPSASAPPGVDSASKGAKLFNMHCTLCHGKDGKLGINGAKDLTISTLSADEMVALVSNGKGVMSPYKNVLSKAEIQAVVEHVRTLQAAE